MGNSPMFWRIVRRLITANYGRLFVILLALGAGAAISSALLNLQVDAKRRLTTEFRALGANVIVAPRGSSNLSDSPKAIGQNLIDQLPAKNDANPVTRAEFLYGIVDAWALDPKESDAKSHKSHKSAKVVVAG